MFEIGWTEMLVIAIVMIVVVGPKDLPKMLRTFGKTVAKLRGMAGDFQKQFNEALKEAELDDVKKSIDDIRGLNPMNDIKKSDQSVRKGGRRRSRRPRQGAAAGFSGPRIARCPYCRAAEGWSRRDARRARAGTVHQRRPLASWRPTRPSPLRPPQRRPRP